MITRYTKAADICKCQAGMGELSKLLLSLHFECDQKGFFEPISRDPTKAICLLTMQVPDPVNKENTYPVHLLILLLEVLKTLIVDVVIAEEDTTCTSQAETWLQMHKTAKHISKAKAGFAADTVDPDDIDQGDPLDQSVRVVCNKIFQRAQVCHN